MHEEEAKEEYYLHTAHGAYACHSNAQQKTRGERTNTNRPPLLAAALRTPHLTPNAKGDQRLPRLGKSKRGERRKKTKTPGLLPPNTAEGEAFYGCPRCTARGRPSPAGRAYGRDEHNECEDAHTCSLNPEKPPGPGGAKKQTTEKTKPNT